MDILVYLVLVGVLLGLGLLAATIFPLRGARIGLGAVVFLALIVDGTWFLAPLVGWSARLADGVWLIAFVLLAAGALGSSAYYRQRPHLSGFEWPSRRDGLFLLLIIALFGVVVAVLPVPLDTDAQGFGYLALMLRDGGEYTTLAPWYPRIDYLYSPAFPGLLAHLSARFDVGIHTLQLVAGAAVAVLFIWTTYDLGCELDGPRTGRAFMLAATLGTGLFTAFMDSHYTALLALTFSLAFLTFVFGFLNTGRWSSALGAVLCLAGVPLTQPDTTIALITGYAPWLLVIWLANPRPSRRVWLGITAVIPLVALGLVLPWLLDIRPLLESDIESPFAVSSSHWRTLVLMHGGLVVALAALGAVIGLRRRTPAQLLALVWLAGIVEFSSLGLLEKTFPSLMEPLLKYDYPFSLAWHGPIIPYTILGGLALVWLADRMGSERVDRWVHRAALPLFGLGLIALAGIVVAFDPLLELSKDSPLRLYGAFSSAADVKAMEWLRHHTPPDTRVLNHPGPHEADWAPVISERNTVFFRPQPFFQNTGAVEDQQETLRAFWQNPADPKNAELLAACGVQYVLVPQVFGSPDSLDNMLRWRPPLDEAASYLDSPVSAAPYLRLVYDRDGAQVYEVVLTEGPSSDD